MAGAPNPQTRYILDRLGIPDPLFLADVHPKVRDTINRQPVTVDLQASAYEALELFNQSGVRVLPVVDAAEQAVRGALAAAAVGKLPAPLSGQTPPGDDQPAEPGQDAGGPH